MDSKDAIKVFGSTRALAAALGLSVQAIYKWGEIVPPLRQYQIRELRPDFDQALAKIQSGAPTAENKPSHAPDDTPQTDRRDPNTPGRRAANHDEAA